jgi:hypothetical protein
VIFKPRGEGQHVFAITEHLRVVSRLDLSLTILFIERSMALPQKLVVNVA